MKKSQKKTDFPEALQNLTDQLCAAQKQLCAYKATYTHCAGCEYNLELYAAIHNAEQPQIEDLLTKK